jgi:hypothetical protein
MATRNRDDKSERRVTWRVLAPVPELIADTGCFDVEKHRTQLLFFDEILHLFGN